MIRQLPVGFALILRGGAAPVIARLPRAWRNRAYRHARRHGWTAADLAIPGELPADWIPDDEGASLCWSRP